MTRHITIHRKGNTFMFYESDSLSSYRGDKLLAERSYNDMSVIMPDIAQINDGDKTNISVDDKVLKAYRIIG